MRINKRINFEELFAVDQIASKCASNALRYARLSPNWQEGHYQSAVDDDTINKLMKCYRSSGYGYKVDKENVTDREQIRENLYCDYVEQNFRKYIEENLCPYCESQRHFNLILPIVFFSLVLQNEAYSESISRRVLKIEKEGVNCSPWKFRNPYESEQFQLNSSDQNQIRFEKHIDLLKSSSEIRRFCRFDAVPKEIRDAIHSTIKLDGEYERIRYLSEHARAGLFLNDLLVELHDESRAIDTLLRLYMANYFYDLCSFHHELSKTSFKKTPTPNFNSLLAMYMIDRPITDDTLDHEDTVPLCFVGSQKSLCATDFLVKRIRKRDIFPKYYDYLYTNYDWKNWDFIEYFINTANLHKYVNLENRIIGFIKQALQCAKITQLVKQTLLLADAPREISSLLQVVDYGSYKGFL